MKLGIHAAMISSALWTRRRVSQGDDEASDDQRRGVDPRSDTGQVVAVLQQRREMRLIRGRFKIGTVDFGLDRAKIGLACGDKERPDSSQKSTTGAGEKGELKRFYCDKRSTDGGRHGSPSFSFWTQPSSHRRCPCAGREHSLEGQT
jgi:hypothetical protein